MEQQRGVRLQQRARRFLGNSGGRVVQPGADTNNSNLKNTYGEVKVWGYEEQNMGKARACGSAA